MKSNLDKNYLPERAIALLSFFLMMALDFSLDTPKAIVIVSPKGGIMESNPFLKRLGNTYLPNRVLVQVEAGEKAKKLARIIPIVTGKTAIGGKVTAYVCEKGICLLPVKTPDDFATQIKRVDTLQKTIKKNRKI